MGKPNEKRENGPSGGRFAAAAIILAVLLGVLAFVIYLQIGLTRDVPEPTEAPQSPPPVETAEAPPQTTEPTTPPTPVPTPFEPYFTELTDPSILIRSTGVQVDGEIVESYQAESPISFGEGREYSALEGVITFRGNNFRDGAAYGTADMSLKQFGSYWTMPTGALTAPDGVVWTGSGWTGQPLIARWPKETRAVMNMYDWARETDVLTEVIYPSMDGYVYFMELTTGDYTRAPLYIGYTFKGAGSLDPRGYPLLYVGAGYQSSLGAARAFIISLIDGSILYTFGNNDSFEIRHWSMFDSAPLVDAETDTLIWPGENGLLYLITLNSSYDAAAGTVSVEPSRTVKWRYQSERNAKWGSYWLGMETSAAVWQGHIIMADNGGNLMCLDLNTLTLDWVQDTWDDTNSSPVIELEDGRPYVYISTSFHAGWRAPENSTAEIPVWKIDAVTGEVVWSTSYMCRTVSDISGGVQGTIAVGKNNLSDLIFVPVARTPEGSTGQLVALDKKTGEEVWCVDTQMYSWSSPVVFYDEAGDGYIIYCTSGYYIYLLDGRTGDKLDSMNLGGNIEASAAVFENYVVVGHRSSQIYGIELK